MTRSSFLVAAALSLILAPPRAHAQFEALRFVDLPPVGSWAEYQVTRRNESFRMVTSQKVAFLSRLTVGADQYYWFQIEQESDDYGPKRVAIVTQIAIKKEDALAKQDLFKKIHEMIVRVGDAPAFRVSADFLALGVSQNLITGGEKGAGTDVQYSFRDLPAEKVKTKAGDFACDHRKGLGKAEVILSPKEPKRYPVDSILELWTSKDVPFGVVRQSTKQTGQGPTAEAVATKIDSEEIVDLVAFGTGAKSAIQGQIHDYDPRVATQFKPTAGAK